MLRDSSVAGARRREQAAGCQQPPLWGAHNPAIVGRDGHAVDAATLTVTRLGITGKLKLTLQTTNPCESMISTVR